jgi:ABC-type lipoprotein export system ATPase subunit
MPPGDATLISVAKLTRIYHVGTRKIQALYGVDLVANRGQVLALRGRSGSGKTTFLNCIAGLDQPNSGQVWIDGQEITMLRERERVHLRRHIIGFIFQSHALLATYSAAENVDLILRLAGMGRQQRLKRIQEVLSLVGLAKWADHRPYELSGGQQQRVAVARAIAPRPAIILADEPTGELDTITGQQILHLLRHIAVNEGVTILIATHDLAVNAYADWIYHLNDGRVERVERVERGLDTSRKLP